MQEHEKGEVVSVDADELRRILKHLASRSLDPEAVAVLPARIQERVPKAFEVATAGMSKVTASIKADKDVLRALLQRAAEPRIGRRERLSRIRKLADRWATHAAPAAACRNGCNHCCHVGVQVFQVEAEEIAKATGRKREEMQGISEPRLFGYEAPCTFLVEGQCSIYEIRPLACRLQFNMDKDELLCQLIEGQSVPVPYFDHTEVDMLSIQAFAGEPVADVREWFPPNKEEGSGGVAGVQKKG